MFLAAPGLGRRTDAHAARRAPPARPATERRSSPTSLERLRGGAVTRGSSQVKQPAHARRPAAPGSPSSAIAGHSASTTGSTRTGALADAVDVRDGSAGERPVGNRFAVLPMEGWDGTADGRPHRPRAPPLAALRRERVRSSCGARRPRCGPTAGPTRTSSCSTTPPSTTSPRCGRAGRRPRHAAADRRPRRRAPAHPLGPVGAARGHARAAASPTTTRSSTRGCRRRRRVSSPTTSSTSWSSDYVDAAVLARRGRASTSST